MDIDRSEFISMAGTLLGATMLAKPVYILSTQQPKFKAVAFDGLAVFDLRPVFKMAQEMYPEHGGELISLWKTKQFEYTWLRNQLGTYTDFFTVTGDALTFAAKAVRIDISEGQKQQLMQAYLNIKVWPDVTDALKILKSAGIKLALLSNFTNEMMQKGIENSGLQGVFDCALSTDKVKKFKPHPQAYQMAIDAFKLNKRDILFVPFAGWDMAGGKQFGYPVFWLNRQGMVAEELNIKADAEGKGMSELLVYCNAK